MSINASLRDVVVDMFTPVVAVEEEEATEPVQEDIAELDVTVSRDSGLVTVLKDTEDY